MNLYFLFSASYCQSFIEIIDGNIKANLFKSLLKICSPKMKFARNAEGRSVELLLEFLRIYS